MKLNISPLRSSYLCISKQNREYKTQYQQRYFKQLQSDYVQFCSKAKKNKKYSQNTLKGIEFGKEIFNLLQNGKTVDLNYVENLIHQTNPEIKVLHISEMFDYMPNAQLCEAFYFSELCEGFNVKDKTLFLSDTDNDDTMKNFLFASNCAHECTHIAQDYKDICSFLKDATNDDYKLGEIIAGVGEAIFTYFDSEFQASSTSDTFVKTADKKEFKKYHHTLPKPYVVTKSDIFSSSGLKNEAAFRDFVNSEFYKRFINALKQVSKEYPDKFDYLAENCPIEECENLSKQYCAIRAKMEYEAYLAESALACEILKKDRLNMDIFPLYYDMLYNALID